MGDRGAKTPMALYTTAQETPMAIYKNAGGYSHKRQWLFMKADGSS